MSTKEEFKKYAKEELTRTFKKMLSDVDKFCDNDDYGYSQFESVNQNDFMQVLFSNEVEQHSSKGCPLSFQRKSKKQVKRLNTAMFYCHNL